MTRRLAPDNGHRQLIDELFAKVANITAPSQDSSLPVFNIRRYGAVGDGVHDDGPAIQAAISAATAAGGGIVWIPNGKYRFTQTIQLFSRIQMWGESAGYIGPGPGGQLGAVLYWNGGTTGTALSMVASSSPIADVILYNFVLWGNFQASVSNTVYGLMTAGTSSSNTVQNCTIRQCHFAEFNVNWNWGGASVNSQQADKIRVEDCTFLYANTTGIQITSDNAASNSVISKCVFVSNLPLKTTGIDIQSSGPFKIEHCQGGDLAVFIKRNASDSDDLIVEDCECEICDRFYLSTGALEASTVLFTKNTINNAVEIQGTDGIIALANFVGGMDSTGATVGLILGSSGASWQGFGNRYNVASGWELQNTADGSFTENLLNFTVANALISLPDADTVLTFAQYESPRLSFVGTLTAPRTVTLPPSASLQANVWFVLNDTAFALNLTAGSGNVVLPPGAQATVCVVGEGISYLTAPFSFLSTAGTGLTTGHTIAVTGGTVILQPTDYAADEIVLSGALTSDLTVIFPTLGYAQRWILSPILVTLGGFTITVQCNGNDWTGTVDASHQYLFNFNPTFQRLFGTALQL